MFELKWANPGIWQQEAPTPAPPASRLSRADVARTLYLVWEEHCIECAVPVCFKTCTLYRERRDGGCARLAYGIQPNRSFAGHFDFGADLKFRRWGKLEAAIGAHAFPVRVLPHAVEEGFARLPGRARALSARALSRLAGRGLRFDDFVLECYSPHADVFRLIVEYFVFAERGIRKSLFRQSFEIRPGMNFHTVPFEAFQASKAAEALSRGLLSHVFVHPEPDEPERRLVFTWLDFVKYRKRPPRAEAAGHGPATGAAAAAAAPGPAAKLKCVAWDLDNTLWSGTLVETADPARLELRPGVAELLRRLDERGVIQTVVSKNNHDDAWKVIERLGVQDYFVYPAINWGQKSENLRQVAARINIALDTFALIDDSSFERAEVSQALPQVRVFAETGLEGLLGRPELDLPVTEASRTRRLSYLTEMKREKVQASFVGSYDEFLASCRMKLRISAPSGEQRLRCWELIERTNQLNLSGRRYTREELDALLARPGLRGLALECSDRFGNYGLVGFATLELPAEPSGAPSGSAARLVDFVLSCRVAQKRVEHAFLGWLAASLAAQGRAELRMDLVRTPRNKPLQQVFADLPFERLGEEGDILRLRLDLSRAAGLTQRIVEIEAE